MNIESMRVAAFHYILRDDAGQVISSSSEGDPLTYMHGTGSIIPGLERELTGKKEGDEFSVAVSAEDAYGERSPEMISVLHRDAFQGIDDLKPGLQFQVQDNNGHVQMITVQSVDEDRVTVDRNHPLAGKDLYFDISVVSVRDASDEENRMRTVSR